MAAGVVTLSLIIVNVALPAMSRDFDVSLATVQWVSTAFVLGLMTTMALTGWASSRFGLKRPLVAALAIGGALAGKKSAPASVGTFRTDGPTFGVLLIGVIVLTAGLMVFPALTLGPIVEGLMH